MRRIIGAFLALVALASAGLLGVQMETAGATVPCSVSGDGWFINGTKINRCTWNNGNQLIIEQFDGNTYEGVVFNGWIPTNMVYHLFYIDEDPAGGYDNARIVFCPTSAGSEVVVVGTSPGQPGWERDFQFWNYSRWTPAGAAGSFNHFNGWSGLQPYGQYSSYPYCDGSQKVGFQLTPG